jgi:hypothetical protein
MSDVKPQHIVFQGEMQLAGWQETHSGGAKVTFWLPSSDDLDPFRTLTSRKGKIAGHRLAVVMVEIGDDELPVDQQPDAVAQAAKGGQLAKLAGVLCNDPRFIGFLYSERADLVDAVPIMEFSDESEMAAEVVRRACGVKSRAELDHNETAAKIFHSTFRVPFVERYS